MNASNSKAPHSRKGTGPRNRGETLGSGAKWTVMVFMGADTIAGNAPLRDAARNDLEEMALIGSGGPLDIFVQVHGLESTPLWGRVTSDPWSLSAVPGPEAEPAGGAALEHFIARALTESQHDPSNSEHYSLLVLWGHAYDFALGRIRRADGTVDALDFAELSDVLDRLQRRFKTDQRLDILAFDACDVATVEMVCQLEPFARYLLGSQIGVPLPGWPYDQVLSRLRRPHGTLMNPEELGAWTVRRYCEAYPSSRTVALTCLDLSQASELAAHADVLATTLVDCLESPSERSWLARSFKRSQTDAARPYVDLADLCLTLSRESPDLLVREASRALGDFLLTPRALPGDESNDRTRRPFVVEHGRNSGRAARLNGISIYAPHVVPTTAFEAVRPLYHNFQFAQKSRWSELVHTLARLL